MAGKKGKPLLLGGGELKRKGRKHTSLTKTVTNIII